MLRLRSCYYVGLEGEKMGHRGRCGEIEDEGRKRSGLPLEILKGNKDKRG